MSERGRSATTSRALAKRARRNTTEEMEESMEDMQQNITLLKESVETLTATNNILKHERATHVQQISDLIAVQKIFSESLEDIQNTLGLILKNQQTDSKTLKDTSKNSEQLKEKLQQQTQQQQRAQQSQNDKLQAHLQKQQQENSNAWVQVVRKTNATNVDLKKSTATTATTTTKKAIDNRKKLVSKNDRRILIARKTNSARANTLKIRDTVNEVLTKCKTEKNAAVMSAFYNEKGTILLTTREDCSKNIVLKYKQQIYEALKNVNSAESMNALHRKIETMNTGIALVTSSRWISRAESRLINRFGSIVIAIDDHKRAEQVINAGLWIDGYRVKTEKFLTVRKTDQCGNCQEFGHHVTRCNKETKCGICAAAHNTSRHFCAKCKKTAQECAHYKLVCTNCKGAHRANDVRCEMIVALRKATTVTTNEKTTTTTTEASSSKGKNVDRNVVDMDNDTNMI